MKPGLEEAVEEILELKREIDRLLALDAQATSRTHAEALQRHRLECAVDDLNVLCKFWRQAAEHAVEGWNKLEDKYEAAQDALREACAGWRGLWESDYNTPAPDKLAVLESFVDDREEWAPPPNAQTEFADLGFGPLRVVEDEKPR